MILASSSPRRVELLRELGFSPVVRPADVDETPLPQELPQDLTLRLARLKAHACERNLPPELRGDLVVAADTTVWLDRRPLGKPRDEADARRMLRALSGRSHHVSTGVCLLAPQGERRFVVTSTVCFFELTAPQIDAYVASGEPLDKAGAYGIQGLGRLLVRGIEGDYYNVVGLPVARLVREMDALMGSQGTCVASALGGSHDGGLR